MKLHGEGGQCGAIRIFGDDRPHRVGRQLKTQSDGHLRSGRSEERCNERLAAEFTPGPPRRTFSVRFAQRTHPRLSFTDAIINGHCRSEASNRPAAIDLLFTCIVVEHHLGEETKKGGVAR